MLRKIFWWKSTKKPSIGKVLSDLIMRGEYGTEILPSRKNSDS